MKIDELCQIVEFESDSFQMTLYSWLYDEIRLNWSVVVVEYVG